MGGVFLGTGDDSVTQPDQLPSEYGLVGTTVYFSASINW